MAEPSAASRPGETTRVRSFLVIAALLLASCDCSCDPDPLVRQAAAPGAIDCGRARAFAGRDTVMRCIEGAIERGEPFMGAWSVEAIDADRRTYVIQDADGVIWMHGFFAPDGVPCPRLVGGRCTSPLERRTTPDDGEVLLCDGAGEERSLCVH